jgi:hypothetical protein
MLKTLLLTTLVIATLAIKIRVTVDRSKGPVCFY